MKKKTIRFLGCLGFLGFLGFIGIWSYEKYSIVYPFCFFSFFGFFGFFFEGRGSQVFKDERYRKNKQKADCLAYRIGLYLLIFLIMLTAWLGNAENNDILLITLVCGISMTIATTVILSQYFLYRFDRTVDSGEEKL